MDSLATFAAREHLMTRILTLHRLLRGLRKPHDDAEFEEYYAAKKFTHLVGSVQRCMEITELRLVVGIVKNAPTHLRGAAWVQRSDVQYLLQGGDPSVKAFNVYLRKSFLEVAPYQVVVFGIAHEIAHLLLALRGSLLCYDEKAVDLCAMMMGFGQYYPSAKAFRDVRSEKFLWRLWQRIKTGVDPGKEPLSLGYLSHEEIQSVNALIEAVSRKE